MAAQAQRLFAVAALLALGQLGCEEEVTISATDPPIAGTVKAFVNSTFGLEDNAIGIDLPSGLQVTVTDADEAPVADAVVRVWPGGRDPQVMTHQGGGLYQIEVLSGRLEKVEAEYFFEVTSEWIEPNTVVLRVPHEPLTTAPTITQPEENSDHTVGDDLTVAWQEVQGAECYDILTRVHELQREWDVRQECVTRTAVVIPGDQVQDFSFLRVHASRSLGDEAMEHPPYFSLSESDAQVRIFLSE